MTWRGKYDVWGNPQDGTANGRRGYTGHEHLTGIGLIHMNGRVYDPAIGRFLSPDTFVQFPDSTQNYNRYTYVGNNPLSYSDPSGHFLKDLVVRAVLSTVMGPIAGAMVSGYISSGGNLKATLLAGANAFTSNVIGKEFGHNLSFNKGEIGKLIGRSFAHGIAQGALSQAGGGRFSDGFIGGFARQHHSTSG